MKRQFILVVGLCIGLMSCVKDNLETKDYRDIVTGEYNGIKVSTYLNPTTQGFDHDTSNIVLTLAKSEIDSIIDISFNPVYSNYDFSFKFVNGNFVSTTYYHPPILKFSNDSLYFKHQAGLGPYWTECFTKKVELRKTHTGL